MSASRTFAVWRRQVLELAAKVLRRKVLPHEEDDMTEDWGAAFANGDSPRSFVSAHFVLDPKYAKYVATLEMRSNQYRAAASPASSSSSSSSSDVASEIAPQLIRWTKVLSGLHGESRRGARYIIERGVAGGFYWCTGPKAKVFYGRTVGSLEAAKQAAEKYELESMPARSSGGLHKKPSPATSSSTSTRSSRSRKVTPEIPASATLRQQFVKCGKGEACSDCTKGQGHGPYWYAAFKENGRTRSKYLGRVLPPELLERRRKAEEKPVDWSRPTRVRVRNETAIDVSTLRPGIRPPPKFRKRSTARA